VANLAVLGYNAKISYSGRGPLEAASMGIHLEYDDVAFRCNLVSIGGENDIFMEDYSAGHIGSEEAAELIHNIEQKLGREGLHFYPGVSYRHLLVWNNGPLAVELIPPHDIVGQKIAEYRPKGERAVEIEDLMNRAKNVLKDHEVNIKRAKSSKNIANAIWLWGQGGKPSMEPITKKYGIRGAIISAVDLLKGIGIYAGLDVINVPGATGYIDTNYYGKANYALEALQEREFVFVHIEAPDEMGHAGNIEGKIQAIEAFDEKVVGTILNGLPSSVSYRILVLSDHPTPISKKTHASDPSPFAVYSSDGSNLKNAYSFCEKAALNSGMLVSPGYRLIEKFLRDWSGFIETQHL
jgi:2,3-bisphosphoglycerate-independent phosphoglycerate mutase